MITRGETVHTAPKEQAHLSVNLSGKKTLVGRNSGECFRTGNHQRGKPFFGKLSGARTEKTSL
jgi:hypothetical protein